MTASIGSRFHGNIAAILAGTPALILAHDMRTKELCELFSLPHLIIDRHYAPDDLLDRLINVDYSTFLQRIMHMQSEWRLFLYRNGLGCGAVACDASRTSAVA
jgi:polysaccharide pyruvyl transferase WcaK-like protein